VGAVLEIEQSETALPLELTIVRQNTGGITGLSPTVAVRNAATVNSYLDFADNTFKTVGWTTKYALMTEVERGHYLRLLNVAVLGLLVGAKLSFEYHFDDGGGFSGDDADLGLVTRKLLDTSLTRKYSTNKMVVTSGLPGKLTVFDDDNATVLKQHNLLDETSGAILPAIGTPSNRGVGT
jgi:hypothetical protein